MHLTGRTRTTVEDTANSIRDQGGIAYVATLDATDRHAVEAHASTVAGEAGRIDICFNATSNRDVQGTPLLDMPIVDVLKPVAKEWHSASPTTPRKAPAVATSAEHTMRAQLGSA